MWKEIIKEEDVEQRHKFIDSLVEKMSENSKNNGFFGENDFVDCGQGKGFSLNDKELYYMYFDNLKMLSEVKNPHKIDISGKIINEAIKLTIKQYGGSVLWKSDKAIRDKRVELTTIEDEIPSIANQRNQNTLLCTEKAAISHNMWLLTGKTSYFCYSNTENLQSQGQKGSEAYENDAHNWTIVEYDGIFRLYDLSLGNFAKLPSDCIDKMLTGYGLKVENLPYSGEYVRNDHEAEKEIK